MVEKEEHLSGLQNWGLSPCKLLEASGSESHQLRWLELQVEEAVG